jgi:O-antigen/teichoic acid export membrane protein
MSRGTLLDPSVTDAESTLSGPTGAESKVASSAKIDQKIRSGTARVATATGVRQILTTGALALTAATVARCLGPQSFGTYVGGTAAFNLAIGLCDFGFSLTLIRRLAKYPGDTEKLMGVGLVVQLLWTGALTFVLAAAGVAVGGTRGAIMLVLAPALAFSGLAVSRQIFSVKFKPIGLMVMDITTTLAQCAIMLALALAHVHVIYLAANLCVWGCISSLLALILARRETAFAIPSRSDVTEFARAALPMGVASVLASLYFTIDLTLLAWLVKPAELGQYAAAVRLLNVVVMIPGFIMAAGIPGLTWSANDRDALSGFAATLAKWIALTALPLGVGLAVFARPAVQILFGSAYLGAVPLLRILMLAAFLAFASNVLGITMTALGIVRPQVIFNTLSLIVNVTGNIILAPRYGVHVAAWLTVASESIVASYGVVTLAKRISYRRILEETWRPLLAVGAGALVGLALHDVEPVAIAGAAIAWCVVASAGQRSSGRRLRTANAAAGGDAAQGDTQ